MIQMVLKGLRDLEIQPLPQLKPGGDRVLVDVLACAICRTDAKMWDQGHRDLVFPRVLGHEMVVADPQGRRFAVWPGKSCGTCPYCRAGRQNLCDEMQITGFHTNGGFAHQTLLPRSSLIPIPEDLDLYAACFAEPVGCVINAFEHLPPGPGRRILIYGAGTMGLITALYAKHLDLVPLILEKHPDKISNIAPILEALNLDCVQETRDSLFDLVITACPDYTALCQAITKVDKGGHISFFSGITKNEQMETNLINLVHYKEASIIGAYGMKKADMEKALPFIGAHTPELHRLIQGIHPPHKAPDLLPRVLEGKALKHILDFTGTAPGDPGPARIPDSDPPKKAETEPAPTQSAGSPFLEQLLSAIPRTDPEIASRAKAKMDDKAKPLGALGRIEPLGIRLCQIQNTTTPQIRSKALMVFAGDHGVTEEGISAFPAEVTGQMVDNFLKGGAAINVLCRFHKIRMKVVDMGVKKDFSPHPNLIRAKVAPGTRNMALEPAMTREQALQSLENGARTFFSLYEENPVQILGLGEMGIGNTTAAAALICAAAGLTPDQATGRGTGVDDEGLAHKTKVIKKILAFHHPDPADGLTLLQTLGGFELAGIAGAALAAASKGCAVVLDGVISTAAGLIAWLIHPDIRHYFIAGHQSVEKAHTAALDLMGLDPVLDLSMRLGEGTGAALAINLAEAACSLMNEMASFDEARISRSSVPS